MTDKHQRPVRLCEKTRRFARESLSYKYGRDTRKTNAVSLDDIANFDSLSPIKKYDTAIRRIAERAPIRICDGEMISGAATLGLAIDHRVPATRKDKAIYASVSHLTVDFETVLKIGINGIRQNVEDSLAAHKGTDKEEFLQSCLNTVDSFAIWHKRYLDALKGKAEYEGNYKNLQRVPFGTPTSFYEAVQSLWFTFAFIRLCGNWPGIGRIDYLLGDYLKADLSSGVLTLDEAREILAHFFIKGCEWICGGNYGSGDAQHYQNILLAGIDEDGNEITNEVTYLVLDIIEELGISDFPTTVRLNPSTDESLLRRLAEVMRLGGGILAVYNEELIINSLTAHGYPLREARKFANDGCWEVQIPGKTFFIYTPFDSLNILQHKTLCGYEKELKYNSFEELYAQYIADMREYGVEAVYRERMLPNFDASDPTLRKWRKRTPCTVVSLFEQGCIEKGLSYFEGGPIYNLYSPHIGGLPDTANSLYAIKKLVYDEKKLTLNEFISVLKSNWEQNEALRQFVLNEYDYYGNGNDEVDEIVSRLISDYADICDSMSDRCGYVLPAGASTFGRQLEWAPKRLAAPHGRKAGEILAGNSSPTPGTDKYSATAVIRSYCKPDLKRMVSGCALDLKILPTSVKGEDGLEALISLMRGFVALGGLFMQPDVVDASVLREAQEHPEEYGTLSVRVSGWNARFVTLNKQWQDMIIGQTEGIC